MMQAGLNDLQQCDNVGPGGHEDYTRLQTAARANTVCECLANVSEDPEPQDGYVHVGFFRKQSECARDPA